MNTHPVAELHESIVQTLLSLQTIAVPAQVPVEQTSFTVQALPSLQGNALYVWIQLPVAGSHVSVVQTLLSLQSVSEPSHSDCGSPITLKLIIHPLSRPSIIGAPFMPYKSQSFDI